MRINMQLCYLWMFKLILRIQSSLHSESFKVVSV